MAKVVGVYKSKDNHLRAVKPHVGDNKFNENGSKYLVRPIHKIQLLFENDEVRFPTAKQTTYIIKMMNHLKGSHVLMGESYEL